MKLVILFTVTLAVGLSTLATAEVPQMINYQGYLTNPSGNPVGNGDYQITFSIYDVPVDGTAIWGSGLQTVSVNKGMFVYLLGSAAPLPDDLFEADTLRWLGIKVGTDDEISPRTRLVSVPYAYQSLRADTAAYALATPGGSSNWTVTDSVLYTNNYWGIARGGTGNALLGDSPHTMVNLGVACTTGVLGQDYGYATVGGGSLNDATHRWATVSGGGLNRSIGDAATIGGGQGNTASMLSSTVGGGSQNKAEGQASTVGGGLSNLASGETATIGGGHNGIAEGVFSTIGGGAYNHAYTWATIAGGYGNDASGDKSSIGGGEGNTANGDQSRIGGGVENTASGGGSTISGGGLNEAIGNGSTVGGGSINVAGGYLSTIGGGRYNSATGSFSTVGGGFENSVAGDYSAILGGYADTITSTAGYSYLFGVSSKLTEDSTFMVDMPHIRFGDETTGYEVPSEDGTAGQVMVTDGTGQLGWTDVPVGGSNWTVTDSVLYTNGYWGIARGSAGNTPLNYTQVNLGVNSSTLGSYATIAGGLLDTANGAYSVVAGGVNNSAKGDQTVICGGGSNKLDGKKSIIGGGAENHIGAEYGVIMGGYQNSVTGDQGVVCSGRDNHVSGLSSFVGSGFDNDIESNYSFIGGGWRNTLLSSADFSYLFGINSTLAEDSTFMVDMPHIRFGDEASGYEVPSEDGTSGQVMATDGSGQVSWVSLPGIAFASHDDSIMVAYLSMTSLLGLSIDVPSDGYLAVEFSGNARATAEGMRIYIDTAGTDTTNCLNSAHVIGLDPFTVNIAHNMPVQAGSHSISVVATRPVSAGWGAIYNMRLRATYHPVSYNP